MQTTAELKRSREDHDAMLQEREACHVREECNGLAEIDIKDPGAGVVP